MSTADIKKLAPLLGWRITADHHGDYWEAKQERGIWDWTADVEKESLTDQEAVIILNSLAEKGLSPLLHKHVDGWYVQIWRDHSFPPEEQLLVEAKAVSISEAVTIAALKLVETI